MEWRNEQTKDTLEMLNLGRKIIENWGKTFILVVFISLVLSRLRLKSSWLLSVLKCSKTCTICKQDVFIFSMFKIDGCSHRYCYSCMKRYIEYKVCNEPNVPLCPYDNCHTKLNKIERYRKFLSFKARNLLEDRIADNKVNCPYSDCSFGTTKGTSNQAKRCCSKCHRIFCIECRVPWHNEMCCEQYRMLYPATENDAKFEVLARDKSWRPCPNCKFMIERKSGCKYIHCRCGGQFCYKCGNTSVRSGFLTCSC